MRKTENVTLPLILREKQPAPTGTSQKTAKLRKSVSLRRHFFPEKIFVFRHYSPHCSGVIPIAQSLVGTTSYRRPAVREEAPSITDCLTSIWHVFKQSLQIDIPLTYVGDMPRQLLAYSDWRPLCIPACQAKCGDLLFVKNKNKPKLISHVALVLDSPRIFHCSAEEQAAIQPWGVFFAQYEQRLPFLRAIRYIDPRNRPKRTQEGDIFIGD